MMHPVFCTCDCAVIYSGGFRGRLIRVTWASLERTALTENNLARLSSIRPLSQCSLLIAAALSYPALDLVWYLAERAAYSTAPRVASTSYSAIEGNTPKNIILIYAESLEATYFNTSPFR